MSIDSTLPIALAFYAAATLTVLTALVQKSARLQRLALGMMIAGFVSHTVWIGVICSRTQHPPLTNLPEAAAFIAWTIFAVELFLLVKYKVQAAAFFVYPLVLMLLTISAVVHEQFTPLDPSLRSKLFIGHLLFTAVGVAGLLIGVAFIVLSQIQQRALKDKRRGALYDWIPSLQVCDLLSYRSVAVGFGIYTVGILAGVLWAYRTYSQIRFGVKELGALVAWVMFAAILQAYITGSYRAQRILIVAGGAFVSIIVALLGIHHG